MENIDDPKIRRMSEYIPFDLQQQIIGRLPVKSLIQCRSLSKAWKSLIDSPKFIAEHSLHYTQPKRLLVSYKDPETSEEKYVSIADDDSFPHNHKFYPTFPLSAKPFTKQIMVGTSHGLLCFSGYYSNCRKPMVVLWNPSIRKHVAVVHDVLRGSPGPDIGFGVCPVSSDPMILKMTSYDGWKVEVYTLSSRKWKTLSSYDLPDKSVRVASKQVATDGFIYWVATSKFQYLILSFDMANEKFKRINLPERLASAKNVGKLSISKLRESLVVLEYNCMHNEKKNCGVWVMERGVQKSLTKLFTVTEPHMSVWSVLGFRKSGEPIMETAHNSQHPFWQTRLLVYEPHSHHINDLELLGQPRSSFVNSYSETLLLLNQGDSTSTG